MMSFPTSDGVKRIGEAFRRAPSIFSRWVVIGALVGGLTLGVWNVLQIGLHRFGGLHRAALAAVVLGVIGAPVGAMFGAALESILFPKKRRRSRSERSE